MSSPIMASFSGTVSAPKILDPQTKKVVSQGKKCDRVQLGENLNELKIALVDHKLYKKIPRSCFPTRGVFIQVNIEGQIGYLKVNAESLRKRLHIPSPAFKKWIKESAQRNLTPFVKQKLEIALPEEPAVPAPPAQPAPFKAPRNVEELAKALDKALAMPQGDDRSAQIDQLMATCETLFKGYKTPQTADLLRDLADRLEPDSPEHAESLRGYAHNIIFPEDMVQEILNRIQPEEALGFHAASKPFHTLAKKVPRTEASLGSLKTAEEAIKFVKKFGATLTYVNISNIPFDDPAKFEELLKHLPKLERLVAWGSLLGYDELQLLKKYPPNKKLKELTFDLPLHGFNYNDVTNPIIEMLAKIENLENLEKLALPKSKISDPAIKALVASPFMKNLRVLNLMGIEGLGREAMPAVAASPFMHNLEELILWNSEVFDIDPLAHSKNLPNLRILDLSFGNISDERVQMLSHLKLVKLNLQSQRKITDLALNAIMEGFAELKELTITTGYGTKFSKEKLAELKRRRPDLKVIEKK